MQPKFDETIWETQKSLDIYLGAIKLSTIEEEGPFRGSHKHYLLYTCLNRALNPAEFIPLPLDVHY